MGWTKKNSLIGELAIFDLGIIATAFKIRISCTLLIEESFFATVIIKLPTMITSRPILIFFE